QGDEPLLGIRLPDNRQQGCWRLAPMDDPQGCGKCAEAPGARRHRVHGVSGKRIRNSGDLSKWHQKNDQNKKHLCVSLPLASAYWLGDVHCRHRLGAEWIGASNYLAVKSQTPSPATERGVATWRSG